MNPSGIHSVMTPKTLEPSSAVAAEDAFAAGVRSADDLERLRQQRRDLEREAAEHGRTLDVVRRLP